MAPNFMLTWTEGTSKLDSDSWRLLPLTPTAFSFAKGALSADWMDGIQANASKHELFVFRDSKATLNDMLKSLREAGFSLEDVHISAPDAKRESK